MNPVYKWLHFLVGLFFSFSLQGSTLTVLVGMEERDLEPRVLGCLCKRHINHQIEASCSALARDLGLGLNLRFGASICDLWQARHNPTIKGLMVIAHGYHEKKSGSILHDTDRINMAEVFMGSFCEDVDFIGLVSCFATEIAGEYSTFSTQKIPLYFPTLSSWWPLAELGGGTTQVCGKIREEFPTRIEERRNKALQEAQSPGITITATLGPHPIQVTDGTDIILILPPGTGARTQEVHSRYAQQVRRATTITFRALPLKKGFLLSDADFHIADNGAAWEVFLPSDEPRAQVTFIR